MNRGEENREKCQEGRYKYEEKDDNVWPLNTAILGLSVNVPVREKRNKGLCEQ